LPFLNFLAGFDFVFSKTEILRLKAVITPTPYILRNFLQVVLLRGDPSLHCVHSPAICIGSGPRSYHPHPQILWHCLRSTVTLDLQTLFVFAMMSLSKSFESANRFDLFLGLTLEPSESDYWAFLFAFLTCDSSFSSGSSE
jgi:hypothetical protein